MARGLRLCTGAEWTLACAGTTDRRWPYGDVFDPEACHDGAEVRTQGGEVLRSGEKKGCRTPEGVHDLSGNLWEWTQERGADGNPVGVLRGGGWNLSAGLGQCRARATPARGYRSPEVGARCCTPPAAG
jgi:formylglycine-generating enzyme required for sulfatase activity